MVIPEKRRLFLIIHVQPVLNSTFLELNRLSSPSRGANLIKCSPLLVFSLKKYYKYTKVLYKYRFKDHLEAIMNRLEAFLTLQAWDKKGKYVFTKHELGKLFYKDNAKTLSEGLHRLVKDNLLIRPCRTIYLNPNAQSLDGYTIERIAKALRPGEYNYISLESILSEYGVISQIPIDRLTVMTTGRKGICKTSYGIIEFTHTKRSIEDLLQNTIIIKNRPLRIATKETAWRDLKRVGRNTNMVQLEELDDE